MKAEYSSACGSVSVFGGLNHPKFRLVHVKAPAESEQPKVKVKKNLLFIFDVSWSMKDDYENLYAMLGVLLDDSIFLGHKIDFIFFGTSAEFYSAEDILHQVEQNSEVENPLKNWFDTLCKKLHRGTNYSKAFDCLFKNIKTKESETQEPYTIFFATDGMPNEIHRSINDVCLELSDRLQKTFFNLDISVNVIDFIKAKDGDIHVKKALLGKFLFGKDARYIDCFSEGINPIDNIKPMDKFKEVVLTATYSSIDVKKAVILFETTDGLTEECKVSIINGEGAFLISEEDFKRYIQAYTLKFGNASINGTLSPLEKGKKIINDLQLICLSIQSIPEGKKDVSGLYDQLDFYAKYLELYKSNLPVELALKKIVAIRKQLFQSLESELDRANVNASMIQEMQGSLGAAFDIIELIKKLTARFTHSGTCSRMVRKVLEAARATSAANMDGLLTQLQEALPTDEELYPLEKPVDNLITFDGIKKVAYMLFTMPKKSGASLSLLNLKELSDEEREKALIQDRLYKLLSSKFLKPDLLIVNLLDAILDGEVLIKLKQSGSAQLLFQSEYTAIPILSREACLVWGEYIANNLIFGRPFITKTEAGEDREDSWLIFFAIVIRLLLNNKIRAACGLLNYIAAFMGMPVSGDITRFELVQGFIKKLDMRAVTLSNKSAEDSCDVLRNPYTAIVTLLVTFLEKVSEKDGSVDVEEFTRACLCSLFSALRIGYRDIISSNTDYQETRKKLIESLLNTVTLSVEQSVLEKQASAFLKLVQEKEGEDLGKALRSFKDEFLKQCNPYLHGTIEISDEIRKCCAKYFLEILSVDRGIDPDGYMLPKAPSLQTFLRIFLAAETLLSRPDVKAYLDENDGYLSKELTEELTKEINDKVKEYQTITIDNIDDVLEKLSISKDDLVRMVTTIIALDADNDKIFKFKLSEKVGQLSLSGLIEEEDLSKDQKGSFLKAVGQFINSCLAECCKEGNPLKQEKLWKGILSAMDMFDLPTLPEESRKYLKGLSDPYKKIFELYKHESKKSGIELLQGLVDQRDTNLCTPVKCFNVTEQKVSDYFKVQLEMEQNKALAEKVKKIKKDSKSMREPVSALLTEVLEELGTTLENYAIEKHNIFILTKHHLALVWNKIKSEDKHVLRCLLGLSLKEIEALSSKYGNEDISKGISPDIKEAINKDIENKQGLEVLKSSRTGLILIAACGSELLSKSHRGNNYEKTLRALKALRGLQLQPNSMSEREKRRLEFLDANWKMDTLCGFLDHLLKELNIKLISTSGCMRHDDELNKNLFLKSSDLLPRGYAEKLEKQGITLFKEYNIVFYIREQNGSKELIVHKVCDSQGKALEKVTDLAKKLTDKELEELKKLTLFTTWIAEENRLKELLAVFSTLTANDASFFSDTSTSDTRNESNAISAKSSNTLYSE